MRGEQTPGLLTGLVHSEGKAEPQPFPQEQKVCSPAADPVLRGA